ncbi:kinase-like domain-containing protein, partial [Suillus plorans]
QVWNQLVSRESEHGIISNEHTFVLVHRQGHSLQISPSYRYQPADEEERAFTMSDLSFFIAHSVMSRLDQQGKWQGAPSPGPLPVSLARWRSCNAAPKLPISSSRPNSPLQLIFTTSGCPSFPLQLSVVDKFNWDCSFSTPLVLESLISHTQLPVFRGHLNGSSVVVKMAEDDLCNELMDEAQIYQELQPIHGSAVPTCRGVFSGAGAMFLLMDDVGASPTSFMSLSFDQRCGVLKSLRAIHRLGVIHNDLAASNIAISDSTAIILDFGQSEIGHVCPGADLCPELIEGAAALGIDPTDVI